MQILQETLEISSVTSLLEKTGEISNIILAKFMQEMLFPWKFLARIFKVKKPISSQVTNAKNPFWDFFRTSIIKTVSIQDRFSGFKKSEAEF